MKKEYIIGGLALLGVIGVISYLRKPKRNSEGFFGAGGDVSSGTDGLPDKFKKKGSDGQQCFYYKKFLKRNGDYLYAKAPLIKGTIITRDEYQNDYNLFLNGETC